MQVLNIFFKGGRVISISDETESREVNKEFTAFKDAFERCTREGRDEVYQFNGSRVYLRLSEVVMMDIKFVSPEQLRANQIEQEAKAQKAETPKKTTTRRTTAKKSLN